MLVKISEVLNVVSYENESRLKYERHTKEIVGHVLVHGKTTSMKTWGKRKIDIILHFDIVRPISVAVSKKKKMKVKLHVLKKYIFDNSNAWLPTHLEWLSNGKHLGVVTGGVLPNRRLLVD